MAVLGIHTFTPSILHCYMVSTFLQLALYIYMVSTVFTPSQLVSFTVTWYPQYPSLSQLVSITATWQPCFFSWYSSQLHGIHAFRACTVSSKLCVIHSIYILTAGVLYSYLVPMPSQLLSFTGTGTHTVTAGILHSYVVSLQTFAAGTHTFALRIHYTTWNECSYRLYVSQPCAIHNIYTHKVGHTFTAGAYTFTYTQHPQLYSWYTSQIHGIRVFTAGIHTFLVIFLQRFIESTYSQLVPSHYILSTYLQLVSTPSQLVLFTLHCLVSTHHRQCPHLHTRNPSQLCTFTVGIYNLTSGILHSCVVSTSSMQVYSQLHNIHIFTAGIHTFTAGILHSYRVSTHLHSLHLNSRYSYIVSTASQLVSTHLREVSFPAAQCAQVTAGIYIFTAGILHNYSTYCSVLTVTACVYTFRAGILYSYCPQYHADLKLTPSWQVFFTATQYPDTFTIGIHISTLGTISTLSRQVSLSATQYPHIHSWYLHLYSKCASQLHSIHNVTTGTHIFTAGVL